MILTDVGPTQRELPMPDSAELRPEAATWLEEDSKQLVKVDSQQSLISESNSSEVVGQALLQDVGLRTLSFVLPPGSSAI